MIQRTRIDLTASGSDGSATASGTTGFGLWGVLEAVHVNHGAGAATTDFTLASADPSRTIMAQANSVTDACFYPTAAETGADGSATSSYRKVPLCGDKLTASLAEANDDQTCVVTIIWDDLR